MAGEYPLAQDGYQRLLAEAEQSPQMSPEALANALLATVLSEQVKHRSKADLLSFVEHYLDNLSDDEFVITRGC